MKMAGLPEHFSQPSEGTESATALPDIVETGLADRYVAENGRPQHVYEATLEQMGRGVGRFQDDYGMIFQVRIRRPLLRGDSQCKFFADNGVSVPVERSMLPLVEKKAIKQYGVFAYACALLAEMNGRDTQITRISLSRLEDANPDFAAAKDPLRGYLRPYRGMGKIAPAKGN